VLTAPRTAPRTDPDARLTRQQAAAEVGVSPYVISMWRYRGKLQADEGGRYRRGDVLAVELETRYSPNNRVRRAGRRWVT
jgi:hypothetical protein